jgi:hypothetical protein
MFPAMRQSHRSPSKIAPLADEETGLSGRVVDSW